MRRSCDSLKRRDYETFQLGILTWPEESLALVEAGLQTVSPGSVPSFVRLAGDALDECRRRVRQELCGSALGFRNLTNYTARALLESGGFRYQLHPRL